MFQGQIDQDAAIAVEASAIPDVLFERGLYWASGRSGVVNLVAAHKWFNLAALNGSDLAQMCRAEISEEMTAVRRKVSSPEVTSAMTRKHSDPRK